MNTFTLSFLPAFLIKTAITAVILLFLSAANTLAAPGVTINLSSANTASNGITQGELSYGQKGIVLFGFQLTVKGTTTINEFNISSSTSNNGYFSNGRLYRSSNSSFSADDAVVGTASFEGTNVRVSNINQSFAENGNTRVYYFLVADYTVNWGSVPANMQFKFVNGQNSPAVVQISPQYEVYNSFSFSGNNFSLPAVSISISNENTPSNGISSDSLTYGQKDIVLFGFGITVRGTLKISELNIGSSLGNNGYFTNGRLYRSADNFFSGDDISIGSVNFSGTNVRISGLTESFNSALGQTWYYFLAADYVISWGNIPGTMQFKFSSGQSSPAVIQSSPYKTFNTFDVTGFNFKIVPPKATVTTLNEAINGITQGPLVFGQQDVVLFGFGLTVKGKLDISEFNISNSGNSQNNGYFSGGRLYRSNDNIYSVDDISIGTAGFNGSYVNISGLSEQFDNINGETSYYFLVADYSQNWGNPSNPIQFKFENGQSQAAIKSSSQNLSINDLNTAGRVFNFSRTFHWLGSKNSKWEDRRNWSINDNPGPYDIINVGVQGFTNSPIAASNVTVSNIIFGTAKNVSLTVNKGYTLTISGDIIQQNAANIPVSSTLSGQGSIIVNSITIGNGTKPSSSQITRLSSSISSLTVNQNIALYSENKNSGTEINNASFELISGTASIKGTIKTVNASSLNTSSISTKAGSTLNLSSSKPGTLSDIGTNTLNFQGSVNYNGASSQTIISGNTSTAGTNIVYTTLKINNPAGAVLSQAETIPNLIIGDETANSICEEKRSLNLSGLTKLTLKNDSKLIFGSESFSIRVADEIDPGSTIEFNREGNQTIVLGDKILQNVILSGSGIKTITASSDKVFNIGGSLTIYSPAAIDYNGHINAVDIDSDFNGTGFINSGSRPITIGGSWNNTASGIINGLVTYDGSIDQRVGGLEYKDLILSNGGIKKVINNAFVTGNVEVKANTTLDANGKLTLKASENATANIKPLLNGAKIIGLVTVQAFFKGGSRGYLTLSSPVADNGNAFTFQQLQRSMIVTGKGGPANGFDAGSSTNPYGPTIQIYNESAAPGKNQYIYPSSINESIEAGKGFYFYFRGNRTNPSNKVNVPYDTPEDVLMEYTGIINQGDISVPLSYTNNSGAEDNGFNIVGNPYPAVIDLDKLLNSQENKSWIFKKNSSYAVYDSELGQGINGATRYILPGQGFFIKTPRTGAVLTFTENCKVSPQTVPARIMFEKNKVLMASQGTKIHSAAIPFIKIALKRDSSLFEETIIALKDGSSSKMTAEDASYLGAGKVSISSFSSDDKILAINYMPKIETEDSEVKLNISAAESGSYSIEAPAIAAMDEVDILLTDAFTNKIFSLKSGQPYSFIIDKNNTETYGKNRFKISFVHPAILPVSRISFKVKRVKTGAALNWLITSNTNNTRFEVERSSDGRSFISIGSITDAKMFYSYIDTAPAPGINYYRLKQTGADGRTLYYEPEALTFGPVEKAKTLDIQIYPNPVVNELYIALNEKRGPIEIKIYDMSGKTIKSEELPSPESIVQNVSELKSGIYIVEVVSRQSNQVIGNTKFIKQ